MMHLKLDTTFDPEKLIKEVRSRTILWQNSSKINKVRFQKKQEWMKVAEAITPNWSDYSEKKRIEISEDLQKKWRNLRDYHFKSTKQKKVLTRKAPYLQLLHFLDRHDPPKSKAMLDEYKAYSDIGDDNDGDDDDDEVMSHISQSDEVNNDVQIADEMEPEVRPIINTNTITLIEDPDRSFLISLLPHMKTLDERQKFKFKLNTMKLLDDIKYNSSCTSERSMQNEEMTSQKVKDEITEDDYDPYGTSQVGFHECDTV